MSRTKTAWMVVAAVAVVLGIALVAIAAISTRFDIKDMTGDYSEMKEHVFNEKIESIKADITTASFSIAPSENGECRVECTEKKYATFDVTVDNGVLKITQNYERPWYDFLSLSFVSPKVKVFIPKGDLGVLTLNSSTGNVTVPNGFTFEKIDITATTANVALSASVKSSVSVGTSTGVITLDGIKADSASVSATTGGITLSNSEIENDVNVKTTTGAVKLEKTTCNNVTAKVTTGSLSFSSFIAKGDITATSSTGSVRFDSSDGENITVKTTTGSVTGSLNSEKFFITDTSTGKVSVPETRNGGECRISTTTGNVDITLK